MRMAILTKGNKTCVGQNRSCGEPLEFHGRTLLVGTGRAGAEAALPPGLHEFLEP